MIDTRIRLPRSTPSVLWIELTSRCPFHCVFCSREVVRGAGRHMDFALYERLLRDLDRPQLIRLNYSGESSHYPHLVEACALAAQTGADVELVSALAALPLAKVPALVASGLGRLTISLHTLDPAQFTEIYGFASVDAMKVRIEQVVELAAQRQPVRLAIDFAFVAMERNLAQLPRIAEYARALGVGQLAVHPVIRRDPIPERFAAELDESGRLRPAFLARLRETIAATTAATPEVRIDVSTPELGTPRPLDAVPRPHPWPVERDAVLHGCDQDPWETVHVLADGDVTSCEVRDRIVLGRLDASTGIRDVWNSEAYREFRARFVAADDANCRACPYKLAHRHAPLPRRIATDEPHAPGLLWGWHAAEHGCVWSRPQARFAVAAPRFGRRPVLAGRLPASPSGRNVLRIRVDAGDEITVENPGAEPLDFRVALPMPTRATPVLSYEIDVLHAHRPREHGDGRQLGFALTSVG